MCTLVKMSVALAMEPCKNGGEVHPGLKWQLGSRILTGEGT